MPVKKKTKEEVLSTLPLKDQAIHDLKKITFTTTNENITANITVRTKDLGKKPALYLYTLDQGFKYISSLYPLENNKWRFDYQPKGDMTIIYEVDQDGNVEVRL